MSTKKMIFISALINCLMMLTPLLYAAPLSMQDAVIEPSMVPEGQDSKIKLTIKITHPDYKVVMVRGGYFIGGSWGKGALIQSSNAVKGDDEKTWTATLPVQADVSSGTRNVYIYAKLSNGTGSWLTRLPCGTFAVGKKGKVAWEAPVPPNYSKLFKDRLAASKTLRQTAQRLKSFFPLGVFYFNHISKGRAELEDIKAHGFNLLMVYGSGNIESRKKLLNLSEKAGLKVVPFEDKIFWLIRNKKGKITQDDVTPIAKESIDSLSGHKALLGYYIYDEPHLGLCDAVGTALHTYEKLDQNHPAIVVNNLSGGPRGPLLARQDRIGCLVFVYDNYQPLMSDKNKDPLHAAMYVGVDEAYNAAEAYDIPLWVGISAKNEKGGLERQAISARARVYLALAHGAKGIIYFPYQTTNDRGNLQQGLINQDGTPTPAWDEFKIIGKELNVLAPLILKLKKVKNIAQVKLPIDAQTLEHVDGNKYLIITNLNIDKKQDATIRINGRFSFTQATNVLNGKKNPIIKQILKMSMLPGEGLILKLE